ncbi:hypothetical protein N9V42_02050 [Flavobacteriaceae bacterium]|nr:hypothetical protein [Flavobacteriaceae bacterium]
MKNLLLLLTTLLLVFACSKEESSKTFDTFLDKYNDTSWISEDNLLISFSNGTYFMSFMPDKNFTLSGCYKLKEGNQIDNELTLEILKNEPNLLEFEMKFSNGNLFTKDKITANGEVLNWVETGFDEKGLGFATTYNLTKTNESYSDYCN